MSVMLSSILLAMMVAGTAADDTDYCDVCSNHTMCIYPTEGPSSDCPSGANERALSDSDKNEIRKAHNDIRQAVKSGQYSSYNLPAAQDIPDLSWDDELASVAQRWADQCFPKPHDDCRKVPRFSVGQNVASKWTSPSVSKNLTTDAVNPWFFNELNEFTQTNLTFVASTISAGHLTQVIWAATTKIGCGMIAYPQTLTTSQGPYNFTRRNYICNYGPAGNVINQEIYQAAP